MFIAIFLNVIYLESYFTNFMGITDAQGRMDWTLYLREVIFSLWEPINLWVRNFAEIELFHEECTCLWKEVRLIKTNRYLLIHTLSFLKGLSFNILILEDCEGLKDTHDWLYTESIRD